VPVAGNVGYVCDTHSDICNGEPSPCDDGFGYKESIAVIKVSGSKKAFKNTLGGLGVRSDLVCTGLYGNKYFYSTGIGEANCEYPIPMESSGVGRIELTAGVMNLDAGSDGGRFNISVKFYEVLQKTGQSDRYVLLAATEGSISVKINDSRNSNPVNFTPDLRDGSSMANCRPIIQYYSEDYRQMSTAWKLNFRSKLEESGCDQDEFWAEHECANDVLIPALEEFYSVKYPGYGSGVNGNPPYAGQSGWSTTQPSSSFAMLAMNGSDWLMRYLLMSSGYIQNTVYMMHYDMGNLGKMYYRGEAFSGGLRVRQIEYCDNGVNFGQGQILWTFSYDSLDRIQYIHNASYSDPNNQPDPNSYSGATAYYNYDYSQGGTKPVVTYYTRPDTQSDWTQQRNWELEFDSEGRAIKFQGGCSSGCGGTGTFEHVEYFPGRDDLITKQYNAADTQILDNQYEEIKYGQYEPAGGIRIPNGNFKWTSFNNDQVGPGQCGNFSSLYKWDITSGGPVTICDQNDVYDNYVKFSDTTEQTLSNLFSVVSFDTKYTLQAQVRAHNIPTGKQCCLELWAVKDSQSSLLMSVNFNDSSFSNLDWKTISLEWDSTDDTRFGGILLEDLWFFKVVVKGLKVDMDDIQLSTAIWVGNTTKPMLKQQRKRDSQDQWVTTLTREFDKNNFWIWERQFVSANDCRVTRYDYEDETFTNLVKKIEWQNLFAPTSSPTGTSYETIYSNDANNIVYLPGDKRADYTYYDPCGKISRTYRHDRENDANALMEYYEYDTDGDGWANGPITDSRLKKYTNVAGGVTEYEYDSTTKLLKKKIDPQKAAGRLVTEYIYDGARRVVLEQKTKQGEPSAILQRTVNHYNPVTGYLDWTRDDGNTPEGGYSTATTYYLYNSLGQMIRQTNPDGVKTGNSYGSGGQLVSDFTLAPQSDPNDPDSELFLISQTLYTYTADGLIEKVGKYKAEETFLYKTSIPDPADPNYWVVTKYEYYPDGKQKKVIEDFGNANLTTEYFYNLQGEVEKVIYPTGKWVKTTRDGRGLVTHEYTGHGTDSVVLETAYVYDADGNLKEQHNADGTSQFYTYNNFGQLKKVYQQDPINGPFTEKFYDSAGNVNRELSVDADGTLLKDIRRKYDVVGNLEMERICDEPNVVDDTADVVTWYKYDVLGNLQYTVQDGPNCSDPNSIADPNNIVTEYMYDGLGRRQHTLSPVGVLSSVFYTPGGLPETIVDPNDPVDPNADCITRNYYDAAGRLEKTVDPEGHYTHNSYNSLNQLIKQTVFDCNETPDNTDNDFAVRQTRIQYDNLGNVIRQAVMKNPASQDNLVVGTDLITDYIYDYTTGLLYQTKTYYGDTPTAAVTTFDYDEIGRKISTMDPEGNEDHITYSEDAPVLVEKTQRLEHNPGGDDYTITTFFDYDDYGRLWKRILDKNGDGQKDVDDTTTEYLYDGLGRLTNEIAPDGIATFTDYDSFGNVWQKIEDYYPLNSEHFNKTTEYVYNRLNRLDQIKAYDPNDTTSQVAIQTTTYEYDKAGAVTKIIYPDNKFVRYIYNIQNKLDTEIQRNGKWIAYWYDDNRNLIQVSDYDQNDPNWPTGGSATFIETFTYDAANNLKTADKVEGEISISHSEFTYNGFGLKTSETATYFDLDPVTTTLDYDGSGNLISQSSTAACGQATLGCDLTYTHDGLGRIKTIDRNEGRIVNYSYIGTATKAIEYPEPQITQSYSYDELGRVDGIRSADSGNSSILDFVYDYDEVGNRQSEKYNHLTTPVWDKYQYDNLRRLNQVDYAQSSGFSLATESTEDTENIRFAFLVKAASSWLDEEAPQISKYHHEGHEEREDKNPVNPVYPVKKYTSVNSVSSVADKLLTLTEFGESDAKPRTETVYDDNGKIAAQLVYDSQGNMILFAMYPDTGDKVVITSAYDKDGNMTSNILTTYDAQGNIISREDMPLVTEITETAAITETVIPNEREESIYSASSSFSSQADLWLLEAELLYDDGGMMLMSAPSGPLASSEEFAYDHLGNRYQYTDKDGYITTYTHNPVNQYGLISKDYSFFGLSDERYPLHDENGNLSEDGKGYIYTYDYRNRLIKVELDTETVAEYTYDALGRRIAKTVGDTVTYFYYDTDNRVIAEYEGDTTPELTKEYVYGNGITEVLAMFLPQYDIGEEDFQQFLAFCAAWLSETGDGNYDDDLDLVNDNKIDFKDFAVFAAQWGPFPSNVESHFYYLTDALGSVRGLIGGKFNREEDQEFYNYDVYGATTDTSVVGNPFMFAGYLLDTESGLYLLEKRSYDPVMGRFLQFDPISYADSMNLYEYAISNPIMFTDPTGEAVCSTRAEARQKAIEDVERKAYREPDNSWHLDSGKWGQGSCAEAVYFKLKRDCKPAEIPNEKGYTDEYEEWERVERLSGKPEFPDRVDADINKVGSTITNASDTNRLRPFPGFVPGQIVGVSIDGGTRIPVGGKGYNNVPGLFPNSGPIKTMNIGKMHRVTWKIYQYWRKQQYIKGFYRARKECTTETLLKIVLSGGGVINKSGGKINEVFKSAKFRFKEKGRQEDKWELDSVRNYGFTPSAASETWVSPPQ
jgi:RHS repeat-associated protein